MSLPRQFETIYECEHCGHEYDMTNCFLTYFWMPCDECGEYARFMSQKVVHRSFEWDRIEEGED